ncbi:hypothetical protein ARMGADRAFT_1030116 [Armillaria gallica]|uniref:Uncharacterized protein n=1 Tax=Armillaria gallica TaxID=47427 RepID=A0A2H3DE34_ARMGA|nr:hypothetical protein ARMGADRAFT_1030116 [Armillaria gallica]
MVAVIILLYIVATINFVLNWLYIHSIFVEHGQSFWTRYLAQCTPSFESTVEMGVTGVICTILVDSTIIWCCWIVWEWQWLVVLLPNLLLISGSAFILATTLWCMLLIIYHIVTVAHRDITLHYFDCLVGIARGIALTLLIGHVVAGHAFPDNSWQGSVILGSLRFNAHSRAQDAQDSMMSDGLEAHKREDRHGHHTLKRSQDDVIVNETMLWVKLESHASSISEYKDKAVYRQGSITVIPSACLGVRSTKASPIYVPQAVNIKREGVQSSKICRWWWYEAKKW